MILFNYWFFFNIIKIYKMSLLLKKNIEKFKAEGKVAKILK